MNLKHALVGLCLLTPSAFAMNAGSAAFAPQQSVALRAHADPALEALRAGRVEAPVVLRAEERSVLSERQQSSSDLLALRGGALTDHEWTMLAIGAAVVLLIILL